MAKSKIMLGQVDPIMQSCQAALAVASTFGTRIKLREALRALDTHAQDFNTERQALVEKYAEQDEDGKPIVKNDMVQFGDNQDEVDAKWRELVTTQVTVTHKLTLDDVAGLPGDASMDALELLLI